LFLIYGNLFFMYENRFLMYGVLFLIYGPSTDSQKVIHILGLSGDAVGPTFVGCAPVFLMYERF